MNTETIPQHHENQDTPEFYVVSKSKFTILYICTLGLYSLYWCYRNWRLYAQHHAVNMMPIFRAFFMIFFIYSLFHKINNRLQSQSTETTWHWKLNAVVIIILWLLSSIIPLFSPIEEPIIILNVISFAIYVIAVLPLREAQDAINYVHIDQEGETNDDLTLVNYVWIILGVIITILYTLGFFIF